jgi:hypothetical protein
MRRVNFRDVATTFIEVDRATPPKEQVICTTNVTSEGDVAERLYPTNPGHKMVIAFWDLPRASDFVSQHLILLKHQARFECKNATHGETALGGVRSD